MAMSSTMRIARSLAKISGDGAANTNQGMTHVDETEREACCAYLDAGSLVVRSPMNIGDALNPDSEVAIPVMWFTDGVWIWSAQVSYYLATYGLIFESELLDHIRSVGFQPVAVSDKVREQALSLLLGLGDKQQVTQPD